MNTWPELAAGLAVPVIGVALVVAILWLAGRR